MSHVKGKFEQTEENMQVILDLGRSEQHCQGRNDFGFICYMKYEENNTQLWVIVSAQTHEIRNAGINLQGEYRVWRSNIGFSVNIYEKFDEKCIIENLTFFQVFNAMRIYIISDWQQTGDDDIAMIITDFMLTNDTADWKINLKTWDPPVYDDWMNGVDKTFKDLGVLQDPKSYKYNQIEAFLCMQNYLQLFYTEFSFDGVRTVIDKINKIKIDSDTVGWQRWLLCVKYAVDNEDQITG